MKRRRKVTVIPRPYLGVLHVCEHCGRRWVVAARHPTEDCTCGARVRFHEVQCSPRVVQ